jgi:hypothetical protein
MAKAPADIIALVEKYSGLALADVFAVPGQGQEIKRHARCARQNGVHVSPTFMIDGLAQSDMSSQDTVSGWVSPLLAK